MSALCRSGCRMTQFVAFLLFLVATGSAQTTGYSCGSGESGTHCYGINIWTQASEYFGVVVDITQTDMACPLGCGGFVDDEVWLADRKSGDCVSNQFNACWVEAGTLTSEGSVPTYFWAYILPGTELNVYYLGSTDPVGTIDHYLIIKDARSTFHDWIRWGPTRNKYLVLVYNDSGSTSYAGSTELSGASKFPQIVTTEIDIGQELAGTPSVCKEASAGNADFTNNLWAYRALSYDNIFWGVAQTALGSSSIDYPPYASWVKYPGDPNARLGGDFTTSCCRPASTSPPSGCGTETDACHQHCLTMEQGCFRAHGGQACINQYNQCLTSCGK